MPDVALGEAGHHREHRGLSAARVSDQTNELALGNREIEALDDDSGTARSRKVFESCQSSRYFFMLGASGLGVIVRVRAFLSRRVRAVTRPSSRLACVERSPAATR